MMSPVSTSADSRGPVENPAASPPASRLPQARWRDPRLVVGIAIVALSVLLGARLLGSADDSVGVWATRTELSAGQQLAAGDLVRRQVRFADGSDADRYLSADAAVPAGSALVRDVGAGELLPRGALGVVAGEPLVEVPLSVGTDAVPVTVRVGSVVDVWVTTDPTEAQAARGRPQESTLVFDDVRIVAAPRSGAALGPSATRQVIVGVGADQQGRLPAAIAAVSRGIVLITRRR
jgi:hypothetical protein